MTDTADGLAAVDAAGDESGWSNCDRHARGIRDFAAIVCLRKEMQFEVQGLRGFGGLVVAGNTGTNHG